MPPLPSEPRMRNVYVSGGVAVRENLQHVLSVVSAQIGFHSCPCVLPELRETGSDWGLESRLGARAGWDWGPESRAEGPDWDWSPGCLPRLGWTGGWSPWPEARTEAGVLSGAQDSGTQFGTVCGLETECLERGSGFVGPTGA